MQQPRALIDQIQEIIAKYRTLSTADLKDLKKRTELAEMIDKSTLPAYHKEVRHLGLLTQNDGETTLALYLAKQQELLRHTEALLTIERRVLEERLQRQVQSKPLNAPNQS